MDKNILLIFITIILFSSCRSTYYYATLDSKSESTEKVENGDFLLETDSLWIAHCFKGSNAPVQITIFNKLDEPLYIDWDKSALIMNNMAMTYTGRRITSSSKNFSSVEINGHNINISVVNENSSNLPSNVTFIPPKSMISEIPIDLGINLEEIGNKAVYRKGHLTNKNERVITIERADFDKKNSPINFKSYLTIYDNSKKEMSFEQNFYLKNLIKTHYLSPDEIIDKMIDRGDFFYVTKPADYTPLYTTLGVIAGVVGGVIAIIVDPERKYRDDDYYDY